MSEAIRIDKTQTLTIVVDDYVPLVETVEGLMKLKDDTAKEKALWENLRGQIKQYYADLILHNELGSCLGVQMVGGDIHIVKFNIVYKDKDLRVRATEAQAGVLGGTNP